METLAVHADVRIARGDLGIWSDDHITGLRSLVDLLHSFGAKVGAQIGHAGRNADLPEVTRVAFSPIPFTLDSPVPGQITIEEIPELVKFLGREAMRAREAGFDVLEIHAAHGYLLSEFLSPLANLRDDEYGGDATRRYRILREIIEEVKVHWGDRPLFVRISSTDYAKGGNTPESFLDYARWMKKTRR